MALQIGRSDNNVMIWYSLASAYFDRGDILEAQSWYERVVESGTLRIVFPFIYVRSLYFLGKIHEEQGNEERGREYYKRFVDYWAGGDIDLERVEEAKAKLLSIPPVRR